LAPLPDSVWAFPLIFNSAKKPSEGKAFLLKVMT